MKITIKLTNVEALVPRSEGPDCDVEDLEDLEKQVLEHVGDLLLREGIAPGVWLKHYTLGVKVEKTVVCYAVINGQTLNMMSRDISYELVANIARSGPAPDVLWDMRILGGSRRSGRLVRGESMRALPGSTIYFTVASHE